MENKYKITKEKQGWMIDTRHYPLENGNAYTLKEWCNILGYKSAKDIETLCKRIFKEKGYAKRNKNSGGYLNYCISYEIINS